MSNLGLFFHSNYSNQEKYLNYIQEQIKSFIHSESLSFEFKVSNNTTMGVLNWGVFGGMFSKYDVTILFDGYLLDDYTLTKEDQCEQLYREFTTKGIDFIKKRNFFGNIIISTKEQSYIVTSQHTIFYLFYTITKEKELIVAPAIKYILPFLTQLDINFHAYYELLKLEHCVDNKTLFKAIHKIPSNTIIEYCHNSKKIQLIDYSQEYWDATPTIALTGSAQADAKIINDLFQTSTQRCTHIIKNQPISLSFSAGTDSSYVLSHLLDANLPVTLSTKLMGAKQSSVISPILEKLKNTYSNIAIKGNYFNYSNLSYDNCLNIIDESLCLREVTRPLADWHVSCLADSEPWSCFTDGATGDGVIGGSIIEWYNKWTYLFQTIFSRTQTIHSITRLHKQKSLSDKYHLKYSCKNKVGFNHSYSMIFDHYILHMQNHVYNKSSDHVHILRNHKEYFLTSFYENDFFRVVMQYPYSEKYRNKLYYYLLNEQGKYFNSIPIENTNKVLPKTYQRYHSQRSESLVKRVWNKIKRGKISVGSYSHCVPFYEHFGYYKSANMNKLNEMDLMIDHSVDASVQSFILDRYIEQSKKKLNQF